MSVGARSAGPAPCRSLGGMLNQRTRIALLLFGLLSSADLKGQSVPAVVEDALEARESGFCLDAESEVSRDSVSYFPALTIFVARCTTYFGLPTSAAVAIDTTGLVYLLDSEANARLIELRYGRPAIDSTTVFDYVLTIAKLQGVVAWDAELIIDDDHADPTELAPMYPTDGDCTAARPPQLTRQPPHSTPQKPVWNVQLDAATGDAIVRVSAIVVDGFWLFVDTERVCAAMHGN